MSVVRASKLCINEVKVTISLAASFQKLNIYVNYRKN